MTDPEHRDSELTQNKKESVHLCNEFQKNLIVLLFPLLVCDWNLARNQTHELLSGIFSQTNMNNSALSQEIVSFLNQETQPLIDIKIITKALGDALILCGIFLGLLFKYQQFESFQTFSNIFDRVVNTFKSLGLTNISSQMIINSVFIPTQTYWQETCSNIPVDQRVQEYFNDDLATNLTDLVQGAEAILTQQMAEAFDQEGDLNQNNGGGDSLVIGQNDDLTKIEHIIYELVAKLQENSFESEVMISKFSNFLDELQNENRITIMMRSYLCSIFKKAIAESADQKKD